MSTSSVVPDAQGLHLRPEGVGLGVVEQREGVGGGARGRHAVALARAARLLVASKPATYAARAAATAASSWVRREPISMHGRPPAASVIRDAAEAIAESWL